MDPDSDPEHWFSHIVSCSAPDPDQLVRVTDPDSDQDLHHQTKIVRKAHISTYCFVTSMTF